MCTIPLDTAKVRLQLQRKTQLPAPPTAAAAAGGGMLATIMCIAREEGVAALWKGVVPGLHRQFLYGGLRIGLYEPVCTPPHSFTCLPLQFKVTSFSSQQGNIPSLYLQVKAFFVGGAAVGDVSLLSKILAALTTGWYTLLPLLQLKITKLLSDCNTTSLSLVCRTKLALQFTI